jgi:hypothetical protein
LPVCAQELQRLKQVNLNAPGVMETLQASNPAHYGKVRKILEGLPNQPSAAAAAGWLRTSFQAKDVSYRDFLLTSFPAQRDISFVLDDTRYGARLAMTGMDARAYPAGD